MAGSPHRVLVILGPTATGKTEIATELARRIDAEIISADSRAFYAGLDIVTAKPTEAERYGVPHHLIDRVPVTGSYDAMTFRQDVERLVPQIEARGRVPMLVGGGTLYMDAVLRGLFEGPSKSDELRRRLETESSDILHQRLREIDPRAAQAIHPNDRLRVVRALEVHELTGRPISVWHAEAEPLPYDFHAFLLVRDRDEHRAAIETQARRMVEQGLVDEIRTQRANGLSPECQAYRTIGVPETVRYLEGELDQEGLIEEMARATWALARRQSAWFRRDPSASPIDVTGRTAFEAAEEIRAHWEERL